MPPGGRVFKHELMATRMLPISPTLHHDVLWSYILSYILYLISYTLYLISYVLYFISDILYLIILYLIILYLIYYILCLILLILEWSSSWIATQLNCRQNVTWCLRNACLSHLTLVYTINRIRGCRCNVVGGSGEDGEGWWIGAEGGVGVWSGIGGRFGWGGREVGEIVGGS